MLNHSKDIRKTNLLGWSIFITGILFYCFAYLLRVYPSVMQNELLSHFQITAGSFGVLTSFYYFAYAPMQLPVGVSVDKIGPRRSLILACIISLTGALIFASSSSFTLALSGRFMIGFGAAFAYVTALKLATLWLPKRYFATAAGAVTGSGMIAAILTDIYLTHLVSTKGFADTVMFPVYVGLALLLLILIFVKDKRTDTAEQSKDPSESHAVSFRELGRYLLVIAKNPQMWIIGLVGALLYLPSSVLLDVWAIPFLRHAYHFTSENAALGVSVMLCGWIISSFATGILSDLLKTRKIPLLVGTFGATIVSAVLIYTHALPAWSVFALLFLLGLCCGPHPLCFTISKENYSPKVSGTAIAFSNFVIMMGGFMFQPTIGKLLDALWTGHMEHGVRVYSASTFSLALSIIPAGLAIACLLSCFIKETYDKIASHTTQ